MTDLELYDAPAPDAASVEDGSPKPIDIAPGTRTVVGYAIVWGAVSSPRRDGFRHVFERGSIKWAANVFAFWNHDASAPLADTETATLRIVEDDIGARVEIDLDTTTDGENTLKRVTSRLVRGMSFGGVASSMAFADTNDPQVKRVTRCLAYEVSPTPMPAMTATNIVAAADAKNLADAMQERKAARAKDQLARVRLAMLRPR